MIKNVKYIITTHLMEELPQDDKKEIVIVGRSNVGKSSLINMITDRKALAKTSQTPGKTQLINHFNIDDYTHQDFINKYNELKNHLQNNTLPEKKTKSCNFCNYLHLYIMNFIDLQ